MIVDPIQDHTYLAWGTFWRRSNRTGYGRGFSSSGFGASYFDFWFTLLIKDIYDSYDFSQTKKRGTSLFQNLNHNKFLRYRFYYGISFAKTNSTVFLFPQLFFWETLSSIVIVIPQFDWLCDMCGCVISPTSGIYCVDLSFINNYKEPQ